MAFTILIRSPYIDIEAFYPYEGWNEEWEDVDWRDDEDEVALRNLIERCISVDVSKDKDFEELLEEVMDTVTDPSKQYLTGVGVAACGGNASIEVDFKKIDNPFSNDGKYYLPDPEVLIPEIINSKFCFVKVWENSGGWVYNGNGEFDLIKLTWERGKFAYDGEEFEFTDGDGSSSYTCFYKDGEVIG